MVKALLKNKLVSRISTLWAKISFFNIFIKYPFFLLIIVMLMVSLTYGVLLFFIDGDFVKQNLTQVIREKAGIKAEFAEVDFSLNYGLAAKKLKLYAPHPDSVANDPASYEYFATPFFQAEELNIRYDLPSVLLAKLSLSELAVIRPTIRLVKSQSGTNLDGITRHLEKFKDSAKVTQPVEPASDQKADTLLPVHPKHIYLPLGIVLQNIGIKDLAFEIEELSESREDVKKRIQLRGLSFFSELTFKGNQSSLNWTLRSEADQGIQLNIEDQTDRQKSLSVVSDFLFTGHLENLMNLTLDLDHKLKSMTGPSLNLPAIHSTFSMKGSVTDDLRGLQLQDLSLHLGDLFHYKLSGAMTLMNAGFEKFHLNLESHFLSSLRDLSLIAKHILEPTHPELVKDLSADGYLELEKLRINGVIDLKKLKSIDSKESLQGTDLPNVSARVSLNQLSAQLPAKHVSMSPLDGKIAISVSPSLNGEGTQIDFYQNLFLEGVAVGAKTPQGFLLAGIQQLSAKSLIRADWPVLELPLVRNQIDIPAVVLDVDSKRTLELPFTLYQQASAGPGLEDGHVNVQADSGDLLSLSLSGHCDVRCQKLGLMTYFKLNSLKSLHQLSLPFARILGQESNLPTSLEGALSAQIDLKGSLPDLKKPDPIVILNTGDIRFNNQFSVEQLGLEDKVKGISIQNLDLTVKLAGDLKKQSLKINKRVSNITASLPGKGRESSKLQLRRLNLNTEIQNHIVSPILNIKAPEILLKSLMTHHETDLYWNHLSVDPVVPMPVNDFNLKIKNSVSKGSGLDLENFMVDIPGLGINVKAGVKVQFQDSFLTQKLPESFSGNVAVLVDHTGVDSVPLPVKTSGNFKMNLGFDSRTIDQVDVNGDLGFQHFNLSVFKGDGDSRQTVLMTENISGKIPFKRRVDLKPFLKKASEKKSDLVSIADFPGATNNGGKKPDSKDLGAALDQYLKKNQKSAQSKRNAMSLADYSQLRPFYPKKKPIYIKKIEAANLALEDIEFDIELSQNWFSLNQFMMNFLGGRVQGTLRLGFDELVPHTLKATLHLTRLNTHKLLDRFPDLQNKSDSGLLSADPWLDASVHLNYNISDQDISGGIDITSIGKEQLKMILFYVDPEEKDPSIEKIKLALTFGEVDQVRIPIKNSEIDIDVGVNFLVGIPFPVPKITRLPLATLLGNVLKTSKSGQKNSANLRGDHVDKNSSKGS